MLLNKIDLKKYVSDGGVDGLCYVFGFVCGLVFWGGDEVEVDVFFIVLFGGFIFLSFM